MRSTLFFAIVLLWSQEIGGDVAIKSFGIMHNELTGIEHNIQPRSITDIWSSLKNTANRVIEHIKALADKAKKAISDWVSKIKIKAKELVNVFKEQLKTMKQHVNEIITNMKGVGETVKKCLQERKEEIDEILMKILSDVTNCISNSVTHLGDINVSQPIFNHTEFLNSVQSDSSVCVEKYKTSNDIEECVQNVRKGIYKHLEVAEGHILKNQTEMRGATDDLLNTIVECTTDGIIKSTTVIANETIEIIECVSQKGT